MFRRHWGILFAFAGLALGYPIHQHADAQPRSAENQVKAAEDAPPRTAVAVENSLARIASAIEAANADPDAQRSEKHAQSDLEAQQDMAKWAFWMFVAAAFTTLLSALGVFLIWRTLIHTRRASNYAGQMAFDGATAIAAAVEANNAMREGNEIAREGGEKSALAAQEQLAQLRPYLSIDDVAASIRLRRDLTDGGFRVEADVAFSIENSGRSIARNVRILVECSPMNLGAKLADWQMENIDFVVPAHIAPSSDYKYVGGSWCHVPEEKIKNPIYFALCVAYESVYAVGPRQTCEEYIGYKELFGSSAATYDLAQVAAASEPVTLLMRRSGMFSRMT